MASIANILDGILDAVLPVFRNEADHVHIREQIAELRETLTDDVRAIASDLIDERFPAPDVQADEDPADVPVPSTRTK